MPGVDDAAAPVADVAGWVAIVTAAAAASRDRKLAGADLPPAVAASRRALARRFDDRPPSTVTWGFPVVPRTAPPSECGFHLPESLDPLPVDVSSSSQSSRAACEDTGTFYQWGTSLIAPIFVSQSYRAGERDEILLNKVRKEQKTKTYI